MVILVFVLLGFMTEIITEHFCRTMQVLCALSCIEVYTLLAMYQENVSLAFSYQKHFHIDGTRHGFS